MSYRQEMSRLATAVNGLLQTGGTVPAEDVRAAVAGHAALVGLLRGLDHDLAVERYEVIGLGQLLQRQPWITDQPLTDLLLTGPASPAGQLWREVARSATLAQHDWETSTETSRPSQVTAWQWAETADLASLAEAVAVLDGDIADSLTAVGRWRDASDYRIGQPDLLLAARDVRALASSGSLRRAPELRPVGAGVVLVNLTPAALPAALNRLARIVATSQDISPAHIGMISNVVADTTASAAAAIARSRRANTMPSLREHAARLGAVPDAARRLLPLMPGDGRALAQAQQIHYLLASLRQRGVVMDVLSAREVARAIPEVTRELALTAAAQIESQRWLHRNPRSRLGEWTVIRSQDDVPAIVQRLRRAASHSHILDREIPQTWRGHHTSAPAPREILARGLAALTPTSPLDRSKIAPRPSPRRR